MNVNKHFFLFLTDYLREHVGIIITYMWAFFRAKNDYRPLISLYGVAGQPGLDYL